MRLVFATGNKNKLAEVKSILQDLGSLELVGLKDIGFDDEIEENGETLEENSRIKAEAIKDFLVNPKDFDGIFADDTGLEVEALNGAPGVYSARFAGVEHDSEANMKKLLGCLDGERNRRAAFRTVISLYHAGEWHTFSGRVSGNIIEEKHGDGGFGYDPVFVPDGMNKTFAELTPEEKNVMSHRGKAIDAMKEYLKESANEIR